MSAQDPSDITILVADDDYGIRFPIVTLLRDEKYNVLEAATDDEIYAQAKEEQIWLIDARLPNPYRGISVVRNLYDGLLPTRSPIKPKYPVLIMSIDNRKYAEQHLELLTDAGVDFQWLEKPFQLQNLLNIIRALC